MSVAVVNRLDGACVVGVNRWAGVRCGSEPAGLCVCVAVVNREVGVYVA